MKKHRKGKNGYMTLGALAALMVFLMMLPLLARLSTRGAEDVEKRAVADHLATILDATAEYIRVNRGALLATAGASAPVQVSIAALKSGNHLLPGFGDRNPWGQSYGIYVLQPASGELEGIVLTYGGRSHVASRPKFGNLMAPSAAALVGGAGGFIPSGTIPGQSANTLEGAFGGWRVPLVGTSIPIPPPGHVGGLSSLRDTGTMDQDFLYRVAVPGHPELNAMQTELDMTNHAVRGVREIQFEEHTLANIDASGFCNDPAKNGRVFYDSNEGLYLCNNGNPEVFNHTGNSIRLVDTDIVTNGTIIPKPTCPNGTNSTPEIYALPSIVSEGDPAGSIASFQTWAIDRGTEWQVNLRVLTSNGWINPGPNYGRIAVLMTCK